ncbi:MULTISPECIES: circadian clock-controlled protein [unclassified Clostridium]|uniref:circadian clock-controlled protein n=1 Tax=unclassified Clostridium TaxID=2614128 RepID=UPI001C8C7F86|nr:MULTISPECIES: circadian clock-controlled protein [unclassified Clostridium]MBX9136742.1 circadian clock-controlled protein [Clostridium sp. K12(2020)]MBX9145167.1 circadian clock-controlled protein [Clostridium sp. K13]
MAKQQISISFKTTVKDSKLYAALYDLDDRGAEIKQVLYKYYVLGLKFNNENIEVGKIQSKPIEDNKVPEVKTILDF